MIESQEPIVEEEKKQEIPDDLICNICNDLFVDAVMIPCCGSSFCDDCKFLENLNLCNHNS